MPGTRVTSCVKLRPFNCNWEISLPVTVPAISELWVSTWATVVPSTVTSMVEPPTCRATSTRAFWAISRTTPLARYLLKPCAVTVTLYKPGAGNAGTEYSPSEFVLVVRLMPFSALVTATCAFTTLAPVESRTVPVKEAVSWACTNAAESTSIATAIPHSRRILIPDSLSPDSTRTVSKQPNACIKTYQYCVRSFSVSRENVGLRPGTLLQAAGGFAHDQLRNDLAVVRAGE